MTTTIQKWGNSLAVRIPKEMAENLELSSGSAVRMSATKKEITIKPAEKEKKYDLNTLVKQMTEKNTHKAVAWGNPLGKELW